MDINENMICPVCKAKLFTDEVAVCPECGAPHHKKCFLGLGHCYYESKHGTAEQWQPPKIEPPKATEQTSSDNSGKRTVPPQGAFNGTNNRNTTAENPFFKANGIDKDELIDGERTEDIAKFVGYNALRYINVFRKMSHLGKKTSWNWVSFLVPEYWLISRKCYIPSILIGFYSVLLRVFSSIAVVNPSVQRLIQTGVMDTSVQNVVMILFAGSVISLILRVFLGLFGDYIYKKKVYSTIKEMKSNGTTSEMDYMQKGGVNLMLPMLLYFGIYAVSLIIVSFI
ncbi:MAG: RING finger protein [Acutalibacteraceae bacterium]